MLLTYSLRPMTRALRTRESVGVRAGLFGVALACQGTPAEIEMGEPAEAPAPLLAPAPPPAVHEFAAGAVIDIGAENQAHLLDGFSLPEAVGSRRASWSEGELSTVAFELRGGAKAYLVAFLAEPYHLLGEVSVGVAVNKRPLGDTTLVKGWRAYRFVAPGDALGVGRNELSFHFAKTGRPSDFDARSNDVRELGARFEQVQIQPIESHAELAFGSRNALALAALGDGWARDPSDRGTGTWTVAQRAVLRLAIAKSDAAVYRLALDARAPRGVAERKVAIILNGSPLGQLAFQDKKSTRALDVPAARLESDNELTLEFDKLESPAEIDPKSNDDRLLGLRVFELDLAPK